MARKAVDGNVKVAFVASIADQEAPTVAELDAGTELQEFITKDGLSLPADQNNVPDDSIADKFDGQLPGTTGGIVSLTMKRESDTDDAWNLVERDVEGYIVVRWQQPHEDAWAAGDNVQVFPGAWHEPVMAATAGNEQPRFTAAFPVRSPGPSNKAVVAA